MHHQLELTNNDAACLCAACLQLTGMFWALLQLGRRLVLPGEFASLPATVACEEVLQIQGPTAGGDSLSRLAVDLMFPATEGTVQRLMASW